MIYLLRAFTIFLLKALLQTWDNMLALQTPSNEPEQQKHCVVHGVWMVGVWKGKSCSSFNRRGHWNTGMVVLKTNKKRDSCCVLPPPATLVILPLEAFSLLANRNKAPPLFVRQHMPRLKINSENVLTALDCCYIGLLFQTRAALVLVSSAVSRRSFFMVSKEKISK